MPRISKLKSEEAVASPVRRSTRLHSQTENNVENKLETPNEEASTTNDVGSTKKIRTRRTSNSTENKPTAAGRKTSTSSEDPQAPAVSRTRTRSASREGTPIKTAAARVTTSREGTPVKAVKPTDNKPMRITRQRRSASIDQETEVVQRVTRSRRNSADVEVAALPQSEPVAVEDNPKPDQGNLNLSIIQENSFNEAEEENQTNKSTSPNAKVDDIKNQSSNNVKNQIRIVVDKLDVSLSPRRSPRLIKCSGKSPCYKKCNCDGTETVSSSSVNVASELNNSKASSGSDKENVTQDLEERSLSNSPISDKSVLQVVPIETTAKRMTNVFTPKGVRYSFNEPMDVDVTLNTPKFNKSLCEDNLSDDESIHLELPEKEQNASVVNSEEFAVNAKEVIELINKSLNSSKELDAGGQQLIEVSNDEKQAEKTLTPINSDIKSSVTDSEQKKEAVEEESETEPINVEAKMIEEDSKIATDMDKEMEIVENESARKSIESKSLKNSSMTVPDEKTEKLDVESEELVSIDIDDEDTDNIQIEQTPTARKSFESKSLDKSKIESSMTPADKKKEKLDVGCEELISIDDEDNDNIQIEKTQSANKSIDEKSGKEDCLEEMKSSFIDITVENSESTDQITEETSDVEIKERVKTLSKSPIEKLKRSVGHDSPVLDNSASAKLDDFISKKLAEFDQKSSSEESVKNSEDENSLIDDMAEEGEEDTPSEDSNQIIDEGESIHTESEPESNLDESYSDDSFICKEENFELLPGKEYDLEFSPKEKKKSRIINVDDRDEDIIVIEKTPRQQQSKKKSRIIAYSGNSSSDDEEVPKSPNRKSTINRAITVLENVNVKDIKDVDIIEKVGNLIKNLSTSLPNEEEITKTEEMGNQESEVQEEAMNVEESDSNEPIEETETAAVDADSDREASLKRAKRKRSGSLAASLKKSTEPAEVPSKGVKRKRSLELDEIKPVKQLRLSDQRDKKKSTKQKRNKSKKIGEAETMSKKKKTQLTSQSSVGSKHSFGLMPQLLTDVKNRPKRLIKPSKSAIPEGWKVEEVQRSFKPSKSIVSSKDLADFQKAYHAKDFRSQMLNDASRIKRVSSKVMLRKKGAYY